MAKKAAETVVLVIDDEGIESLISELLKATADNQAGFYPPLVSGQQLI